MAFEYRGDRPVVMVRTKLSLSGVIIATLTFMIVAWTAVLPWYVAKGNTRYYLLYPWGYIELNSLFRGIPGIWEGIRPMLGFDYSRLFMMSLSLAFSSLAKLVSKPSSKIKSMIGSVTMITSGLLMLVTIIMFQARVLNLDIIKGKALTPFYGLVMAHLSSIILILEAFKLPSSCTLFEIAEYSHMSDEGGLIKKAREVMTSLKRVIKENFEEMEKSVIVEVMKCRVIPVIKNIKKLVENTLIHATSLLNDVIIPKLEFLLKRHQS